MQAKSKKYLIIGLAVAAVAAGAYFLYPQRSIAPSLTTQDDKTAITADEFAQCLKDKGAVFYGTYWCSHCQNQKKLFNDSKNLPYIECSTPDGRGQLPVCEKEGIEGYPTWIFEDGSRQSGEMSFKSLSSKTGCPAPR